MGNCFRQGGKLGEEGHSLGVRVDLAITVVVVLLKRESSACLPKKPNGSSDKGKNATSLGEKKKGERTKRKLPSSFVIPLVGWRGRISQSFLDYGIRLAPLVSRPKEETHEKIEEGPQNPSFPLQLLPLFFPAYS